MINILVIGESGTGKSEWVKEYIQPPRNCFVFDVQNEYGMRTKYAGQTPIGLSDNIHHARARHIELDEKKFILQCKAKKNTVCVFEEATGFFQGAIGEPLRKLMIGKLFTNNVYVFIFHSISSVPPRIAQMVDMVVLYNTLDENYQVEKKYPSIYPYFSKLKESEQKRIIFKR